MPEPTPTTEPGLAPKGKQIPKWGIFAIIGVGVVGLLWYKHKRAQEESTEFQPAETGGQTAEGTIYPDSTSGGAAAQLGRENNEFLQKFIDEEMKKEESGRRRGKPIPKRKPPNPEEKAKEVKERKNRPVSGIPIIKPIGPST